MGLEAKLSEPHSGIWKDKLNEERSRTEVPAQKEGMMKGCRVCNATNLHGRQQEECVKESEPPSKKRLYKASHQRGTLPKHGCFLSGHACIILEEFCFSENHV